MSLLEGAEQGHGLVLDEFNWCDKSGFKINVAKNK